MSNILFFQSLFFGFLVDLIPILVVVLIAWLILSKVLKRYELRANEKLILERENTTLIQKRVDDLNERLVGIEKTLKEVE
jgi:flagellar biosynthesis/type III secretory pathway M-ring protein FliF/YscJ